MQCNGGLSINFKINQSKVKKVDMKFISNPDQNFILPETQVRHGCLVNDGPFCHGQN